MVGWCLVPVDEWLDGKINYGIIIITIEMDIMCGLVWSGMPYTKLMCKWCWTSVPRVYATEWCVYVCLFLFRNFHSVSVFICCYHFSSLFSFNIQFFLLIIKLNYSVISLGIIQKQRILCIFLILFYFRFWLNDYFLLPLPLPKW